MSLNIYVFTLKICSYSWKPKKRYTCSRWKLSHHQLKAFQEIQLSPDRYPIDSHQWLKATCDLPSDFTCLNTFSIHIKLLSCSILATRHIFYNFIHSIVFTTLFSSLSKYTFFSKGFNANDIITEISTKEKKSVHFMMLWEFMKRERKKCITWCVTWVLRFALSNWDGGSVLSSSMIRLWMLVM